MNFSNLPHDVQLIAAKCLADKLTGAIGFADDGIKKPTAKSQAHQVRDAFIALFSDRELEGDKKAAAEKLAATILGLQQLVPDNEIIKTQIEHVVSAADYFVEKCL
ncbi:TPA: hypothetical protein LVL52_002704 [Klebsiella michiganensis]|nr:hypothetical protein [Klebsiella michiganensis]